MNNKSGLEKLSSFLTNLLFPKFCINCGREGTYLCRDCKTLVNVVEHQYCLCDNPKPSVNKCNECRQKNLDGLYFAAPPQNEVLQKLLYEYEEILVKDLSRTLASLIITHFHLLNNPQPWRKKELVVVPSPEAKRKRLGFDPNLEIAKALSNRLKIPLLEILKPNFEIEQSVKNKKLFLVKITYKGKEMEQWAQVLKQNQAEEVWGVTITRTK